MDDQHAWLNSMAQAVVGKLLTALRDTNESMLYNRFRRLVRKLDSPAVGAAEKAIRKQLIDDLLIIIVSLTNVLEELLNK